MSGTKHYIKDFEASYDFVSVYNDLSSRRRQLIPKFTTNVNEASIFRIYSNSSSRALTWDRPILIESGGMWLSISALNYRIGSSGLTDGFPATESFYQIEGDVSPHLLYSTPIEPTSHIKDGQVFRVSQSDSPVIGLFGCNWCVDFAGSQDLNIISNQRRVARSSNEKWYENKCLLITLVVLLFVMFCAIMHLLNKKKR